MKVFILITSHISAFAFGWWACMKTLEYIHEKVDFDEAAKRLMKLEDVDD